MSADELVNRLDHVRQVGPGKWISRCPAHDDRSPSLSIRELEDGRTLVHCFGGCGAIDVLDAVGLDYSALFPPDGKEFAPIYRNAPRETVDELVIAIGKHDIAQGKRLSAADKERYREAKKRASRESDFVTEVFFEGYIAGKTPGKEG